MRTDSPTSPSSINTMRRRLMGAALLAASGGAYAQAGGNTARIIVPFSAGGAREVPARVIQHDLNRELGQNWIIENKPGAGGAIGTAFVGQAAPDGQTLLMAASSHFVTAALGARPAYEPVRDFAPVALIGNQNYVLIVQAALPVKSVADLIAYGKKKPGALNYNSAGVASSTHLAGAYFASLAGLRMVHIPFKSTQEAANDVAGGRSDMTFVPTAGAGVYAQNARVRILAVTGEKRSPALPNVPTLAESGLPRYHFESWFGLLAPGKTPPAVIAKINAAVNRALAVPEVREKLQNFGIDPTPVSIADFNKVFLADRELMARIVKESGITRE